MASEFNLSKGQLAERKLLVTIAEWYKYTLLTSQPSDWSSNYTNYYTKSGSTYVPVTGAEAPTWAASTYYSRTDVRQILGTRTEDSSIEYNADMETTTDILGANYTDVNKTQPQQSFDPFYVMGGSKLAELLNDIRRRNALTELNQFTIYVVTKFIGDATNGYEAEAHTGCTIAYTAIGGDTRVNFPIEVHFSNDYNGSGAPATGTIDKIAEDFEFTPDVAA